MGKPRMQVLDRVSNTIGAYRGVGQAPPPGASTATLAGDMPAAQVADPTNFVRLQVWADFGEGPKWMATGPEWQGGAGRSAPSLAWQFDPTHPPRLVYGVLENGTRGTGSPAVCGLALAFS